MQRFSFTILLLLLFCSAGCAVRHSQGYFLDDSASSANKQLADDATKIMQIAYPPTQIKLAIKPHKESLDLFGYTLYENLRNVGYAISDTIIASTTSSDALLAVNLIDATLFGYVVDTLIAPSSGDTQKKTTHTIRVGLYIGSESLSRAYQLSGGTVQPIGNWTRGAWEGKEKQ